MKKDLNHWSVNDILKLFQSEISRQTLLKAEKDQRIPPAKRLDKGLKARMWDLDVLPEIGRLYGFLSAPKSQVRICVYTAKGGVLKTTIVYTFARILALNGIKVLIVGLDSQGSITALTLNPLINVQSLDDLPNYENVGEIIFGGKSLNEIVQKTDLPTLDIIPETDSLTDQDNRIGAEAAINSTKKKMDSAKRYDYFEKSLINKIKNYDVVLFDNSPSWSFLIENSLFSSDYIISPSACDPGSYQVLENNLNSILDFGERVRKSWKRVFLVPTLKDNNKLSSQIHGAYLSGYPKFVTNGSIRRTVKGAEAFSVGKSPIEYDLHSELSADYFALIKEIWNSILKDQENGN
jgi:chromosome partitioning protein